MRRVFLTFLVAFAMASVWLARFTDTVAAEPGAGAAGKKLDLGFVPEDAIGAVVVQPHRVLTGPEAELFPTEVFSALGNKRLGFDPVDLEQAMLVFGVSGAAGGPEESFGLILRFSKPIDTAAVAAKLAPRGKDGDWQGHKVRIDNGHRGVFCAMIDPRTLLVAVHERELQWLLSAKGGDSALRKLLAAADDLPDAQAFLAIEALRPMIAPFVGMAAQQLPPPF